MVQDLMDRKEIEFLEPKRQSINVITDITYSRTLSSNGPRPITIFHDNKLTEDKALEAPKSMLIMKVPRPFPYKSENMVPCGYQCNYTNEGAAADLTGVGGMTRSGCCYSPTMMEKLTPKKLLVPISKERILKEGEGETILGNVSKPVTEKEACEF